MKRISVHKIEPGMILGEDVLNTEGRYLFSKHLELTDKEIRTLKMWGIPEVLILSRERDETQSESIPRELKPGESKRNTDSLELRNQRSILFLDRWFSNNKKSDPVIKTVYEICLDRISKNQFESRTHFSDKKKLSVASSSKIQPVKDIRLLLNDNIKLPSLPTIFSEINAVIQNPKCSGKDIADIVRKDPSLSATLLKIVNSAYYGVSVKVESLQYAALALGTKQVSALALGITVIDYFKGITDQRLNMQSFWRHSVACGIVAQTLATHIKEVNAERVFIGGLIHDIGRLVFLIFYPNVCNEILKKSELLGLFLYQIEPEYFGMTHAKFGSLLVKQWNFSAGISHLIENHHLNFKTTPPKETAVVYLSNWLINAIGFGSSGETVLPPLNRNAWDALGLSEGILESLVKQVDRQIVEVIKFFYE